MPIAARHTLDQLLVLEAVVNTGSFAGAARALHRVPSAISYAISTLEGALGVEVFDRSGRRATLTPEGRRVLGAAAALLESARRLDALGLALAGGHEPSLLVVVDGALPQRPVMRALRAFGTLGLPTRVQLVVEHQDGVVECFLRERADIVLALDLENAGAVLAEPLPPLRMVLVARADHPLVGGGPVDRAALHGHAELLVRASTAGAREAPRDPWFGGPQALSLSDFHSKRLALREGLGFGWMPAHLVEEDLQEGIFAIIPLDEGHEWTYRPALASRVSSPLGPAGERLRALLLGAHGEAPPRPG